jgi:beta-mannosidase
MAVNSLQITTWTVQAQGTSVPADVARAGAIPASVPGTVHTALMDADLIADPVLDTNENLQGWIGTTDWIYTGTFTWHPDGEEHHELVFEGIDTVASIEFNGHTIGAVRNMHRTYRFALDGKLRDGANDITVRITSPIKAADAASVSLGYRPHTNHHPYNAIRKMACSFGWDWGIDTSTSGLWRPVRLEAWTGTRLRDVRIAGTVEHGVPVARVFATVEGARPGTSVRVSVAGEVGSSDVDEPNRETAVEVSAPDAAIWWPRGHGEASLHDLRVDLLVDGVIVETATHRMGFRSVDLRIEPDDNGVGIILHVNDEPILIRGANWIPDDIFPHRVDRARYGRRLEQAEFAGLNLLRVWGGGIYESEDFYSECDERGILTWQDFLLACAAYAEDEPLFSEFEAEAREAITRISAHPSLVIFNGNNENIWGFQEWYWDKRLEGRTWGAGYYYELFPSLIAELSPHVAYTPGSPFSPDRDALQNDPSQGTTHVWDLWNVDDWPHFRDYRPRFVAEFGWQGPPAWSTLTRSISDDPLTPESPGMLVHQKATKGNEKLIDGLTAHLPLPDDMEDWHWAMSLNQAVAVRTAIEWWRSLTPHCTGTIMWQLNDCWPVTSWAAVDGDERAKPLLHALRQAHREQLVTVQPDDDGLVVCIVNDTSVALVDSLTIDRVGFVGEIVESESHHIDVPARGVARVPIGRTVATPDDAASQYLRVRVGESSARWYFVEYRESRLDRPEFVVDARRTSDGWQVDVSSDVLARDVSIMIDRVDPAATIDSSLVDIDAGVTATFMVVGAADAVAADFTDPRVLRSANDLVANMQSAG